MSWESTVESLYQAKYNLYETVSVLFTLAEDKPIQNPVALVDKLDNRITELLSALEEVDTHILVIQKSKLPGQIESVRNALYGIDTLIIEFTTKHFNDISEYEFISQLLEMGRERGREWREWSQEIKIAVERCKVPIKMIFVALFECWNELAQRMTQASVSMQATNIGQQINLREDQLELATPAT